MTASIFDSTLSHTRRLDASGKKEKKIARPLLEVFACGQVSSPRLYRLMKYSDIILILFLTVLESKIKSRGFFVKNAHRLHSLF